VKAGENLEMHSDAHVHLAQMESRIPNFLAGVLGKDWLLASVSHDPAEHEVETSLLEKLPGSRRGFGIHPQDPREDTRDYLAHLAASGEIDFIGEAGFDFFGDRPERVRTEENIGIQTSAFEFQLDLAIRHGLPLLVHTRKATDILLAYKPRIARLPALIFHSWPGRLAEAQAFLGANPRCFFSFGTTLVRGSPHAMESCSGLPSGCLLSETDAPWQPLKGETSTPLETISSVEGAMASLRAMDVEELRLRLRDNFLRAFWPNSAISGRLP